MLFRSRSAVAGLIDPVARLLLRMGLSPDAVTWFGGIGVTVGAIVLIAPGHLLLGAAVCLTIGLSDLLDGTMARLSNRVGSWGGFLDSTLDRVADAALLGAIAWHFAASGADVWALSAALIALGSAEVTSYIRAKAEAMGASCRIGLVERTERTGLIYGGLLLSGIHPLILPITMVILAAGSAATVVQRIAHVRRQLA